MKPAAPGAIRLLGWLAILAVVSAIVLAFLEIGSPADARRDRSDAIRVERLWSIASAVRSYFEEHKKLPADLAELTKKDYWSRANEEDPVTKKPFEYRIVDETQFELCATFEMDWTLERARKKGLLYREPLPFAEHKKGRQCFTLSAKKAD
ncbi:MAG: hypothetical protein DCC46_01260 [Armatimonadetes bacterium]|nr:MAG: hypothetical protein DCC46_01260 [Armatimonadota bacterium]